MSGTIYRTRKNEKYFSASNEAFNDIRLSWEAKGILGYLLSKPNGWECRNHDLIKQGPAGEHKIKRVLSELKRYGYLKRTRKKDKKGHFIWLTEIFESPSLNSTIGRLSTDGSSTDGSSTDGKSGHIISTESISTESINTEIKDHLDLHFSGNGQASEETGPNPDDQWLQYRDEVLKVYDELSGVWGRTAQERETRRGLLLGGAAARAGFDANRFRQAVEASIAHGVNPANIARFWEVYDLGGDYNAYLDKKYGDGKEQPQGKVTRSEDGGYYV